MRIISLAAPSIRKLFASATVLGIASLGVSQPVQAQQRSAGTADWVKICSKTGDNDVCNVQFNIVTPQGQLVTSVNLFQLKGKVNRRIFQVAVPAGRSIPQGINMQIDKGRANTLPYSLCFPDRCIAEVQLSDGLVKALKGGGEITLTSTNFRRAKNPVKVTLKGFTKAFDGPALKRDEVGARNKKLADELKKKADEARKKLEEAQEKAKSGG